MLNVCTQIIYRKGELTIIMSTTKQQLISRVISLMTHEAVSPNTLWGSINCALNLVRKQTYERVGNARQRKGMNLHRCLVTLIVSTRHGELKTHTDPRRRVRREGRAERG